MLQYSKIIAYIFHMYKVKFVFMHFSVYRENRIVSIPEIGHINWPKVLCTIFSKFNFFYLLFFEFTILFSQLSSLVIVVKYKFQSLLCSVEFYESKIRFVLIF